MASKSGKTEPENFKDKLKSLFRIKDKNAPVTFQRPSTKEFVFTPEILKDIGPESPANNRIKTIKEISDVVQKKKLEENAIEALWLSIQDLVLPQASSDNRHAALQFLQSLIEGQFQSLGILRGHFFNVIKGLVLPENLPERLTLFKLLSENGRNLLEFEDDTGPFLLCWMPDVVARGRLTDFLPLLLNTIKYNAAYIDEDVVCGFVQQTCMIPNRSTTVDSKLCLEVLDAVICYSYLPSHCVSHFVGALCRMVNMSQYCESSWELMRKLLGTHLGHSSVLAMCHILQDWHDPIDFELLRGAVFYLGMALWGSRKVTTLKHTPASVLPSFLLVTSCGSPMVAYEVILSVQRLVKKYGKDLNHTTWDIVMDILQMVLKQSEVASPGPVDPRMQVDLHDILTSTEQLHEQRQFVGSVNRFFSIVEMCAAKRPESSVTLLIDHHASSIHPGKENWITSLYQLLDKYFRHETRTQIRLKALDVLAFVLSINKHMYEDDLINSVVLPHMCHIETDADPKVRRHAVEILLSLATSCSPQSFMDVIGVVEKILNRPLVAKMVSPYPAPEGPEIMHNTDETHLIDIKTAVSLLADLFKVKLFAYPPGLCLKLYDILVTHLSAHYTVPRNFVSNTACTVRKTIVECLLQLRSDHFHRLGFFERAADTPLQYSPYVTCRWEEPEQTPPTSPQSLGGPLGGHAHWFRTNYLNYSQAFSMFIQCLENEKDWQVLKCVLENMPILLQNKTLTMSGGRSMVDSLSGKLCAMVNDRQLGFPEKLIGVREKFTRSDFHAYVFPVLASMVTYHSHLERNRQRELIKCLEFGMVSVCAKMCVNSLRLCTLEMQDVMMRLLPSVLLQLSKISATISMAIPVLAFLSSIVRLPKLYANFVEDEYMSVFAIALPYTNPFKFSHYTVSLAHHVIAIWFIRCRLPFRKGFVQFIQKGLKANVLQQFEDNARLALQNQNEDSSDRHRSGSYSEAALRSRRRMQSGSAISRHDIQSPVDEKVAQFHHELTETCIDVMARYTFGNFSPIPHRSHMAEFLLAGGQSQTWLLGNKLVTITTSGGGVKVGNSGLCEKCQAAYQSSEKEPRGSQRRRHRSAVTFSRSSSIVEPLRPSSQDDMTMLSRSSQDDMNLTLNAGQDVAVQTGSSLNEHSMLDSEPLESIILGMKGPDLRGPSLNLCNCWCTNWAEIYIRAPSGNLSWMMRVENREGMYSVNDSHVPDLSMLFASMSKKRRPEMSRHSRRIESGSIGEEEYESLYAQYFPAAYKGRVATTSESAAASEPCGQPETPEPRKGSSDGRPASLGFTVTFDSDDSGASQTQLEKHHVSEALLIPSKENTTHESSSGSLRRSNSSPSIMSGSSDTLSPRESISDILQFGPLTKGDKPKQGYKSSDSEGEKNKSDENLKVDGSKMETVSEGVDGQKLTVSCDDKSGISNGNVKPVADSTSKQQDKCDTKLNQPSNTGSETKDKKPVSPPSEYQSMLSRQLSPSPASSEASSSHDEVAELPVVRKHRGQTISVLPSASKTGSDSDVKPNLSKEPSRVGINPSFVFLQLYHSAVLHAGSDVPLLLPNNENTERAIKILDHIYPYETHKIGVIYIAPGQTKDEKGILSNQYGSERYAQFVKTLGSLVRLKDCNPQRVYLGGLDTKGGDGEFTYGWQDESTQLIFHIATLMPNKDSDPNCNAKKLHIGNDYVTVVYNDSGEDYKIGIIKGQFNYVNIVIKPLDYESNAVNLQAKEDIAEILGHKDTKVISDSNLAILVRQISIHCNLASMVLQRQRSMPEDPFANHWLERLRKIRRIRSNLLVADGQVKQDYQAAGKQQVDFTEYV